MIGTTFISSRCSNIWSSLRTPAVPSVESLLTPCVRVFVDEPVPKDLTLRTRAFLRSLKTQNFSSFVTERLRVELVGILIARVGHPSNPARVSYRTGFKLGLRLGGWDWG